GIHQGVGLRVDGSSTAANITGNTLRQSSNWRISAPMAPMALLVPSNTVDPPGLFTGYGTYDGYFIQAGTLSSSVSLPKPVNGFPYFVGGSITVSAGSTLTLPPGIVIKMAADSRLLVNGQLMCNGKARQPPYDPIIFTSYRDDGPWGDTDGLGTSTGVSGD